MFGLLRCDAFEGVRQADHALLTRGLQRGRRSTSLVGCTTSTRGRTDGGGTPGAATSAAPGRRSRRGSDLLELRVDDVVGRRGCAAAGMPVTAAVRGRRLGARARVGVDRLADLLDRGLQVVGGALDGVAVAAADRVADP